MKNIKKFSFIFVIALISIGGLAFSISKVLATTGGGTATIAVDGGTAGSGVTVIQSTSHTFAVVLTIPGAGMTLGASSPTFTIPTGFTAPTLHAVATAGDVNADGKWSVLASGGGCAVDSAPGSSTTVASGQVITVDIKADCAVGNTITLTYMGTSAIAMGATALTVSTADAGDTSPVTPLIAGSPTITVTAAATPTPTPTPSSSSSSSTTSTSSDNGSASAPAAKIGPVLNYVPPSIIDSRRIDADSIYLSWGPYSGITTFIVQYGFENGIWLYSTGVTGFSTTINDLPANQPIWVRVAPRDDVSIGTYGMAQLVGGPNLPNTGLAPLKKNISWMKWIPLWD